MKRDEYLKRLPEDIRTDVEEAILLHGYKDLWQTLQDEIADKEDVLGNAFNWTATKQGAGYWAQISFTYFTEFK